MHEMNEQRQMEVDAGVVRERWEVRDLNNNVVLEQEQPQQNNPHPPFVDPEETIFSLMKYLWLPVVKCSVPLMAAWWLLMLTSGHPQGGLFCGSVGISALIFLASVRRLVKRADFSAPGFRVLDIRTIQLTLISLMCNILDFIFNFFAPNFSLFYFNVWDSSVFYKQLEWARQIPLKDYFLQWQTVWLQINHQFILVSFAMLFLIDIFVTMKRMAKRSNVVRQILNFEIVALTQPLFSLVVPMLLMNLIAWTVPPDTQTPIMWLQIHAIALGWACLVLYEVAYYREIPLLRPMGIRGYLLMYSVTMLQVAIDVVLLMTLILVRNIYFELVPGAHNDYLASPGFVLGISRYLDQVSANAGGNSDEWSQPLPYNFTYDAFVGFNLLIFLIRYIKLNKFIDEVIDRLERDDHVGIVA